ncbi:MAG: hypothetical protein V3R57_03010 [Candidatus Bathyarchaeia archaeon]
MKSALAFLMVLIFFSGAAAQVDTTIFPVSISTDFINPYIHPDEIQDYSILITPTTGRVENLKLSIFGKIADYVTLEDVALNIGYGETQEIGIKLNTTGAPVGTYSGFLILNHNDSIKEIPIKINIIPKESKVDMSMEVTTKEVRLPEPIKFLVTIYNVGQRDRFNLHLSHTLNSDNGDILEILEEDATLVTSLTLERTFFSEDYPLEDGLYYIETTVSYDDKTQTFVDTFEFNEPFWTTTRIAVIFIVIIVGAFGAGFYFYKG